jgi:fatty-acyl-CoA synthase
MLAGTHVCLRKVEAAMVFELIKDHTVTHMCGAPIIMTALLAHPGPKTWSHSLKFMVAASAPPAPVLAGMGKLGFDVTHVYGLTEVFGPAVVCEWKSEWNKLPVDEQAVIKARQGVRYLALENLAVMDPETLKPVPKDGETIGEVFMKGNLVMKGYLKNPSSTEKSLEGGWFHTGDLAVMNPDGYMQLKDRSKDIIISGGENISSLEVESILYKHPKVAEAAVVARKDEKWGETPCAFITVKPGQEMSDEELYSWCQQNMPKFFVPRTFLFGDLPKTSTGKVQKHVLRKTVAELKKEAFGNTSKLFASKL